MLVVFVWMIGCAPEPAAPTGPQVSAPSPVAAAPVGTPAVPPPEPMNYTSVDVDTLKGALDAGKVPVLVDVRSAEEYAAGHVPKAINIPVGDVAKRMNELASYKGGEVYVICQSGGRSARASATLAAAGYTPINVTGGTGSWKKKGYPVE